MENKLKILNDPVYGFINIPDELIFDIIEHPYFQRLRRIKQLGLTEMVYPGAIHTRFQHAIGAMHLTMQAIETLRYKGTEISNEEEQAVLIAILLHDIGHGPYSHGLENSIVFDMTHEYISGLFLKKLNLEFNDSLSKAILIFENNYHKKFLHQLVSSQLDMDRMDYLKRDSFFTGVSEGVINTDRIIKMLNVVNDELVVESKGIYSIEKFIIARRLMYWQVYFHKTVLSAEYLLLKIMQRAREIKENAVNELNYFLQRDISKSDFSQEILERYALLDDSDILSSVKKWQSSNDKILSMLSENLLNRKLFKVELQNSQFSEDYIESFRQNVMKKYSITKHEASYLVFSDRIKNNPYTPGIERINILYKDGRVVDITEASDQLNLEVLSKTITKSFLCYPKGLL